MIALFRFGPTASSLLHEALAATATPAKEAAA